MLAVTCNANRISIYAHLRRPPCLGMNSPTRAPWLTMKYGAQSFALSGITMAVIVSSNSTSSQSNSSPPSTPPCPWPATACVQCNQPVQSPIVLLCGHFICSTHLLPRSHTELPKSPSLRQSPSPGKSVESKFRPPSRSLLTSLALDSPMEIDTPPTDSDTDDNGVSHTQASFTQGK